MAYLHGFEHDIFISYARLDEGADEWVSRFHSRLEAELKIWRDLNLERNQLHDQTIKGVIEKAGLLLGLNSYAYEDSGYCQQEVQWFLDRAQKDGWGLSIGDRKRIFHALLTNLPLNEWHPAFSGALGYPFYENIRGEEIALPCDPDSADFKAFVRDLTRDLFKTLRSFRQEILNKQQTDKTEDNPKGNGHASLSSSVLLDTHMKDDDYAIDVRSALRSLNVQAIFNQSEDDPGESFKILEARLKEYRRIIIVFGNVQESWVFNRLSMASEIANRERAALKLGIYFAPPHPKGSDGQFTIGSLTVYKLDDADLRNPQALQSLLSEV